MVCIKLMCSSRLITTGWSPPSLASLELSIALVGLPSLYFVLTEDDDDPARSSFLVNSLVSMIDSDLANSDP